MKMPVHKPSKPAAPLPLEIQKELELHPPRSLRQVLEQDGLTDEVLRIGPTHLGFLIEQLESMEQTRNHAAILEDTRPDLLFEIQLKIDERNAWFLANFDPWEKRLQEVADRRFDGSKLTIEILRRMRGMICREHGLNIFEANALPLPVAVELLLWEDRSPTKPSAATPKPVEQRTSIKPPTEIMFRAYIANRVAGKDQAEVGEEFGIVQGTVSKYVQKVEAWLAAGNKIPGLDPSRRGKGPISLTVDPQVMARNTEDARQIQRKFDVE
jgi:hypothetical protein